MSSVWWNSSVTSFLPVAHWDTLESGISNAVLSLTSNDRRGPAGGDAGVHNVDVKSPKRLRSFRRLPNATSGDESLSV